MRKSIPGSQVSLAGRTADADNGIRVARTIADGSGPGQTIRTDAQVAQ
ncbi:hypothetical protein ACWCPQ_34635 [Nocardia sp. NPDC001965]